MISLLIFAIIVFAVAFGGSRFKPDAWHAALVKPAWNPPNWLFAPVWTVLYACIAIAGWLVWRHADGWNAALTCWVLQLLTNGMWTWLFFGRHRIDLALIDITATALFVAAFIVTAAFDASSSDWVAAALFVPYLCWIVFAAALNARLWTLNRSGGGAPAPFNPQQQRR